MSYSETLIKGRSWMINFKTLVGIAIFLSGCSLFQRHPGSGYADLGVSSSKPTKFYNDQQSAKELEAREELCLKIPNMEGRERYAHSRNLAESFNNFDENIIRLIEKNDIAVGMIQQAVR